MPNRHLATRTSLLYQLLADAIEWPRWVKTTGLIAIDLVASLIALLLAIALRYGDFELHVGLGTVLCYTVLPIALLAVTQFYAHVLRVFQDQSMRKALFVLMVSLVIGQLLVVTDVTPHVPRAVPAIHVFLLYAWLWNSRIILQFLLNRVLYTGRKLPEPQNVLLYGVGQVTKDLVHVLQQNPQYRIVGIVDTRRQLRGARVMGVKIYALDQVRELIDKLAVDHIFMALPPQLKHLQTTLLEQVADIPVKVTQLPSLDDITTGKVKLSDIKPVNVLDVLQRDTVAPNSDLLQKNIQHKVVMVTGAGGSIGSELCRQIITQQPRVLVLFELSEFALYQIQHELLAMLQRSDDRVEIQTHLGSVTHQALIESLCRTYQVETIYHAAAYKHVPIVEANEYEGIVNNFVGTYRTLKAAINTGVATFVAISTDKAVRPTNVMGATKRMAELACQALAASQSATGQPTTTISMVRFGNVLGSSGSVVPLFNKQIAKGGPITVTHPDVTRYFMTIPEAAQLVIQAGAMAQGGEVFVLDMGQPVKILDLAKRMVHLSGLQVKGEPDSPEHGIAIEYVGLRPGEKLYEELIIGGDNIEATAHERIMKAQERCFTLAEIETVLAQVLAQYSGSQDTDWLRSQLAYFVEGYPAPQAIETSA